jgi:hypothetical protein
MNPEYAPTADEAQWLTDPSRSTAVCASHPLRLVMFSDCARGTGVRRSIGGFDHGAIGLRGRQHHDARAVAVLKTRP